MSSPTDQPLRTRRPSGLQKEGAYVEKRSEYQRDLDRVIYDYYFRRLGQITQVSSGSGRVLLHNRMTHSLKVAQVGRRLVQYLQIEEHNQPGLKEAGGIDPDVVDAAGLLHDIGHPPFGHVAEAELNRIAGERGLGDGFEGNAQTFHIVMSLSTHYSREQTDQQAVPGLDLTQAVIAACVKYPWEAEAGKQKTGPARNKWGVYECERQAFARFVQPLLVDGMPTLEAEVMDWADDITYAVHDLQDFYTDGVLPLHRLRHVQGKADQEFEMNGFWDYAMEHLRRRGEHILADEPRRAFAEYAERFPAHAYGGTNQDRAAISHLASEIISAASKATSVKPNGHLYVDPKVKFIINVLKQITWYYVIDRPELISVQIGQRHKVRAVFDGLFEWAKDGGLTKREGEWVSPRRLPVDLVRYYGLLRDANSGEGAYREGEHNLVRATIDYIASMTEAEFDDMHVRLTTGGHVPSTAANHRLD
jgi:dGTPase